MICIPVEEMNVDLMSVAVLIGHKLCLQQFLPLPGWRGILE